MHIINKLMDRKEFIDYERVYLNRIKQKNIQLTKHNDITKRYFEMPLDLWDYVVLLMLSRDEYDISIKIGTMRTAKSFLKLYCHGLIQKRNREPTFDERERLQAFMDSIIYRKYIENLNKIMTNKVKNFFESVAEIIDCNYLLTDLYDLTEKGKETLLEQHTKILKIYNEIKKQTPENLYKKSASYESHLPMMMAMGLSGSAIGFLLASSSSSAQYSVLNNLVYNKSMTGLAVEGFEFPDVNF